LRKTQITYIFGAGASANAIPPVNNIEYRIKDLIKHLTLLNEKYKTQIDSINITAVKFIISDLEWLLTESENHQTFDTLAKKYYIQGKNYKLNRLKRALISYFYFEQNIKFKTYEDDKSEYNLLLDKRYDNLIASIAYRTNEGIKLRGHIKFITWNYDLQIDYALKNYFDGDHLFLKKIKNDQNIHPNHNSYELASGDLFNINSFAVIKLNGNAFVDSDFSNSASDNYTINDFRFRKDDLTEDEIVKEYSDLYNNLFPNGNITEQGFFKYFNFAWENDIKYNGHKNVQKEAVRIIADTKILIIVGYSFPYFNSEIDKIVFQNLDPEQIIIQDHSPNDIKYRLQSLMKNIGIDLDDKIFTFSTPGNYFPIHPET
jgi:hypothetical protein